MDSKVGIILEGGAMRSVFSAGVLDFLLERNIRIPNILAVSAGAYAGMNYVSGQVGRIKKAVIEPLREYKYMGIGTFLKKGTFFDMDYLFDEIPKKKAPFDFESFRKYNGKFLTSTVNLETAETVYYDHFDDCKSFFDICKGANSLPIIARITRIAGRPMLDGGMADAIPVDKALEEGWQKIIVILTRDSSYRKKEGSTLYTRLIELIYHRYPKFVKLVNGRGRRYNASLDKILELEKEGKAFVIRPTRITVGNNESNVDKLLSYYQHGYDTISEKYEKLMKFLKE